MADIKSLAREYASMTPEQLWRKMYDALPASSPKFQAITADIVKLAQYTAKETEKPEKVQL